MSDVSPRPASCTAAPTQAPRILLALQLSHNWERSVLRGLLDVSRQRGWEIKHISTTELDAAMVRAWSPSAIVIDRHYPCIEQGHVLGVLAISANLDLSDQGVPSVCCNEAEIARMAAEHLVATGLKEVAAFSLSCSYSNFGVHRSAAFREHALRLGVRHHDGGQFSSDPHSRNHGNPQAVAGWLRQLPTPCGVFACCDTWAGYVAEQCRTLGLRIPDDIALLGADNDSIFCALASPPLSSVAIPWRQMGQKVAHLINEHLHGRGIAHRRVDIAPAGVVGRRSSDLLCVGDPEIAQVVRWIRQNAHRPLSLKSILRAFPIYRQRLERLFRVHLGRTVMDEIRHARLALARPLLASTSLPMGEVARRSGFADATRLGIAFRRETGMTPSAYRRSFDPDAEDAGRDS